MKRQTDPDVLLLQAAADPTRLAILRQLSDCAEVCACDFTACCDVSQPTVSHHLKVLREAGWIDGERRGTWIWYRLGPTRSSASANWPATFGPAHHGPAPSRRAHRRRGSRLGPPGAARPGGLQRSGLRDPAEPASAACRRRPPAGASTSIRAKAPLRIGTSEAPDRSATSSLKSGS